MEIDRIQEAEILEKLSAAQVRVFQVSTADVSKLTKLDFGNASRNAQPSPTEHLAACGRAGFRVRPCRLRLIFTDRAFHVSDSLIPPDGALIAAHGPRFS
jgi:hypothetical protein